MLQLTRLCLSLHRIIDMPKDNVIPLNMVTRLDLPVDQILEKAKTQLKGVVIIGYDNDGDQYFASTYADGGDILWLLEQCKKQLLGVL